MKGEYNLFSASQPVHEGLSELIKMKFICGAVHSITSGRLPKVKLEWTIIIAEYWIQRRTQRMYFAQRYVSLSIDKFGLRM